MQTPRIGSTAYDAAAIGSQFANAAIPPRACVLDELDQLVVATQRLTIRAGPRMPKNAETQRPRIMHGRGELSVKRTKRSPLRGWEKQRANQLLGDMAPTPASKASGMLPEAGDDPFDPPARCKTREPQRERGARRTGEAAMLERWLNASSADDPYSCWTKRAKTWL